MSATLNGRSAQLDNSRAAAPDPILTISINGADFIAFPRAQVLELAEWIISQCRETVSVSEHVAAKAKSIANSRVAPTSFSNGADPGSGDGVAAVPASPPSSFKLAPKKSKAAKKAWPKMPDRGALAKQPPRVGSFAESVLGVIAKAGIDGVDVAAIVEQLNEDGIEIESSDMEKSVANALHQTLAPHGQIERVERQDRQVFWRCAGAE